MGARDVKANFSAPTSIDKAEYTTNQTGSSVRVDDVGGAAFQVETGSYTDGTHDFTAEESDDDSNWSNVASTDLDGSFPTVDTGSDADTVTVVGYTGNKKYLRVSSTATGTTTGANYGVNILKGYPKQIPLND